ncbi:hypothetical protein GCM10020001_103810 [Nonomuraea salmonea]
MDAFGRRAVGLLHLRDLRQHVELGGGRLAATAPPLASFLSSSARSLIALRSSSEKPSMLITVPCPVAIGDHVLTTLTLPREPALLDS